MSDPNASSDCELVRASGFFDDAFYETQIDPNVAAKRPDLVRHFVTVGGRNGVSPSKFFVSAAYLAMNPDVARAGVNPLVHFLNEGCAEGRKAIAEVRLDRSGFVGMTGRDERRAVAQIAASSLFDPAFLSARHPHVAASGLHPALYYVRRGFAERIDPSAGFDAGRYLDETPDADRRGIAPLLHFIRFGQAAGLVPEPVADERPKAPEPAGDDDEAPAAWGGLDEASALAALRESPLFDPLWYLLEHREVARLAMDPATHYLRRGGPAGLRPSPHFDPGFYLEGAPEGRDNPLLHYLMVGRAQGFAPRRPRTV